MLQGSGPIPPETASALIEAASSLGGSPSPMWEPPLGLDPEEARESVAEMIDHGEIHVNDFRRFCGTHSLVDRIDSMDPQSAANFLLHFWGCPLVSIHIVAGASPDEALDFELQIIP
jgi:hypothetical protein